MTRFQIFVFIGIITLSLVVSPIAIDVSAGVDDEYENVISDTILSSQDPGIGHGDHQLAIILSPSENVFSGVLTYDSSERVQIVVLGGPIGEDESTGMPIWTPDGITMYELLILDTENLKGTVEFSGNALAIHTMFNEPFMVTYTVGYSESEGDAELMAEIVEEQTIKKALLSPLKQMKSGIAPEDVVCKDGYLLIMKPNGDSSACVFPKTAQVLFQRGWG